MDNKKLFMATGAGFIVYFLLGWVIYGMLLMGFYQSHFIGPKEMMLPEAEFKWWALGSGNFLYALVLAYIFLRWASITTFRTGAMAGAILGGLFFASINLSMYSMMKIYDLTGTLVDIMVGVIMSAIIGGTIGWVLGRK